ncbi:Dihydroxyacetone kinase 2 [Vanrija pseudolonga]|uniref:Dihydroxyacetone kinase 2 n=1 Tax=Vanrija pseudolonga TaxID=143232 RepID=A0AAF0YEX6_9TREE|nr:Dihydroxyacetone kinase 2 [Vanrija pseudolonga]
MSSHFSDNASLLPLDYLRGLTHINPAVAVDETSRVLHVRDHDKSKVALISGGGSGHEPAHAGFVGSASLTAAVGGNIFASPNTSQVRRALELVKNDKGTLVIVKRYTGDVLHFGLAGESADDNVAFLIVGDDVAVGRKQGALVGRRGLAGTTLVYKVAGWLASEGGSLAEVRDLAQLVADNVGTIGSSFDHCHVPGTAKADAYLKDGEMEVGTGIHNEPGLHKIAQPKKAQLIDDMVELLTSTSDPDRSFVPWTGKDRAVVMVNNLGGLSELELVGLVPAILDSLTRRGVAVVRIFVGTFMSSLDMPGFSITALRLPADKEELILKGVDAASSAPGWRPATVPVLKPEPTKQTAEKASFPASGITAPAAFTAGITAACNAVIAAEKDITRYDVIAGDGDCGLTLKAGGEAILAGIQRGDINPNDVVNSVRAISEIIEEDMGGTSGALYAIFIAALAKALAQAPNGEVSPATWAKAAEHALNVLYGYTAARPPSRTLMDPLVAFIAAFPSQGLAAAAAEAKKAAENTANLVASAGRAAYVDQDQLQKEHVPDPGAWGLALIFEGFAGAAK